MKTIDLGEKESAVMASPTKSKEPCVWYPSLHFTDNGQDGKSSFDDEDIGKVLTVTAEIKLTGINSRTDTPKGKKFEYNFEVQKLHLEGSDAEMLKTRQTDRAKKRGMA